MDLLIAILLYLGVVSPTGSYTTAQINGIAYENAQPVTAVSNDTTAMRTVNETYYPIARTLDIVDRTGGN